MTENSEPQDPGAASGDVTRLLLDIESGDESAAAELLPLVYRHMHDIASHAFRGGAAGNTLQPTLIVHDAYLRLVKHAGNWSDRSHFYVVAAKAMRQILIDHARIQRAEKRGGGRQRVTLADVELSAKSEELDLVDLDAALSKLTELSARQAQVVELRFLAGLEVEEVAKVLRVSRRTVINDWRTARAFLRSELDSAE